MFALNGLELTLSLLFYFELFKQLNSDSVEFQVFAKGSVWESRVRLGSVRFLTVFGLNGLELTLLITILFS